MFCFILLLVASTSEIQAAEPIILTVDSITDKRGSHSTDQPLSALDTRDLSGTSDGWDQYIEFAPGKRSKYTGVLTFVLPESLARSDVEKIEVVTNFMGSNYSYQRWTWKIRDFERRSYIRLGNNKTVQEWVWTQMRWNKNDGDRYIDDNGKIKIKFFSNNSRDVCNLDQLVVLVYKTNDQSIENQPPFVDAGENQVIQMPNDTIDLSGIITDDGLPENSTIQVSWSQTSGPSNASFVNPNEARTQVSFTEPGQYELRLTADDGEFSISDIMTVTIDEAIEPPPNDEFKDISIQSSISHVQPMTGIVFWADSGRNSTSAIQLEYSYIKFSNIVRLKNQFNWEEVDNLLNQVASRGHQAILRFYFVYPGQPTTVPAYIKNSIGYNETRGQTEGQTTWFPDWSNEELKAFTLNFYSKFAERYKDDPRLAFLQVGFGLWAEYHIYDGPMTLGKTFPSKAFQSTFIRHMSHIFPTLPWSISIDAADSEVSPFANDQGLYNLYFGLFDDSFLHKTHHDYNAECFTFFNYQARYKHSPMGGELNYYTASDQEQALDINGPHGISFEQLAAQYHITYMIGNDQPDYQSMSRIEEVGMATGYKFQITSFKASSTQSKVTVKNIGIAPIYYDAYVTVNGLRSPASLKQLLPGDSKEYAINSGGDDPFVRIESDRLVPGQQIEFEADL